jgi:AdoMet-dependent heme synthase
MQDIYCRKPLPHRRIESLSLLHLGQQVIFLNETGTKIWGLLDGTRTIPEIAGSIAQDHPSESCETILSQVETFVASLGKRGAISRKGSSSENAPITAQPAPVPAQDSQKPVSTKKISSPIESNQAICMTPKKSDLKLDTIRDRIEQMYWKNSYIQKMHLELTYRCNFRCVHCYNATHTGAETEMSTEQWKSALEQLSQMGCHTVTFTGGEVFVRKDAVELMQAACDYGFSLLINTNGSLINEVMMERLEPIRPFVQMVEVSFYGATSDIHDKLARRPGAYVNTLRALKLLKAAKFNVMAKFVTMRDNFDGIPVFERDMHELGIPNIVTSGVLIPKTNRDESPLVQLLTDEQYSQLLATRPESACSHGSTELKQCQPGHVRGAIAPDGSVSPCEWLTDFKLGNLKNQKLHEVWYADPFLDFRKVFEEESECPTCNLNSSCQRCPAMSYLETGHLQHCAPIPRHYAELHPQPLQSVQS